MTRNTALAARECHISCWIAGEVIFPGGPPSWEVDLGVALPGIWVLGLLLPGSLVLGLLLPEG